MADSTTQQVFGRYKQYKHDTKKILEWLCQTARTQGGAANDITDTARLTTSKLISLAEAIAAAQKPMAQVEVEGLSETLLLLDAVIQLRQEYADWYSGQHVSRLRRSNRTHRFFISTLREVRELLLTIKPCENISEDLRDSRATSDGFTISVNYISARLLGVEEPQPEPLGGAPTVPPENQHALDTDGEAWLQELDDREFAIWCSLRDAQDIRHMA